MNAILNWVTIVLLVGPPVAAFAYLIWTGQLGDAMFPLWPRKEEPK